MAEQFPDLSEAIRTALLADADITALLPAYLGSVTIFTRRPVPADAPYPMLVVSPDLVSSNEDGVYDQRPIIVRDIAAYHSNERPENYRIVVRLAQLVRGLFHRRRVITPPTGWTLVDIQAGGPLESGNVADKIEGSVVTLTIRLAQKRTDL